MKRINLIGLDSKNSIKLSLCVVLDYYGVSIAAELQVSTIFSNNRSDSYALISERLGLLDSWCDVLVACSAEVLDSLWHEVVDYNQCLGVEVDLLAISCDSRSY